MSLLFMDGFDAGDVTAKWSIPGGSWTHTSATRFNTGGAALTGSSGSAQRSFTPSAQVFTGFAYRTTLLAIRNVVQLYADGGTRLHLLLGWNTDGSIYLERSGGGTLATTAPGVVPSNVWNHIELSATIADTGGTVEVRVNGIQVINFTGDTRNAGTSTNIDAIRIGGANGLSYDDLYICDALGAAPYNTFLGDVRINTIVPNGVGASTGFSPSAGANHETVDELPYSATDYVSATATGTYDSYTMADLTGSYTVLAVQNNVIAKKIDAGGTAIRPAIRSGATTYYGPSVTLNTNDVTASDLRTVDPATSTAWTISGVNNLEAGMEIA